MSLASKLANIPNITTNYIPRATATGFVNGVIYDNGTNVGIGTTTPTAKVNIFRTGSSFTTLGQSRYLDINDDWAAANSRIEIGLGFNSTGTGINIPSIIGYLQTSTTGYTYGDLYFATRNVTTDTAPIERMRITSAGNVGIGTSSPQLNGNAGRFVTIDGSSSGGAWLELATSTTTDGLGGVISFNNNNIVGADKRNAQISGIRDGANNSGAIQFTTWNAGSGAERMRISSAGDVGIGNTAFPSTRLTVTGKSSTSSDYSFVANNVNNSNLFLVRNDGASTFNGPYLQLNASLSAYYNGTHYIQDSNPNDTDSRTVLQISGGRYAASGDANSRMIRFTSGSGAEIGYITRNGGATISYVSSSDYRLKEDLKQFNGLDLISKIKTYDFKWIGSEHRDYGVIAHELKEVIPNIVSGDKDEVYQETGEMKPQGLDYGKLTPILVKAIQELKAEIDILKAK